MRAILLAGGLSLVLTLVGTRLAIRVLAERGYGQLIREDGPTSHHVKRGTPTMGGLAIVLASVLGYFLAKLITGSAPTASALLLLFLYVGLGSVGFLTLGGQMRYHSQSALAVDNTYLIGNVGTTTRIDGRTALTLT